MDARARLILQARLVAKYRHADHELCVKATDDSQTLTYRCHTASEQRQYEKLAAWWLAESCNPEHAPKVVEDAVARARANKTRNAALRKERAERAALRSASRGLEKSAAQQLTLRRLADKKATKKAQKRARREERALRAAADAPAAKVTATAATAAK